MMINAFAAIKRSGAHRRPWRAALPALAGLLLAAPYGMAQALPAAEASPISTGFSIPSIGGSLQWAVTGSGSLDWGYYSSSGAASGATVSGDVAYLSASKIRPFSMVLSAGHSWGWNGEPSYEFANLGLSQLVNVGRWNFTFSDSVSYLPETGISSLSGVAGVGDIGVPPVQVGPDSGQGILTNYSPEVTNTAGGSVQRQITGKTGLNASGSYSLLRFVSSPGSTTGIGLESDTVTGSAGFTHRIDARNTFGGNYAYSSYIYLNNLSNGVPEPNFVSQSASATYTHLINRRVSVNIAAGPQWTQINFAQNSVSLNAYADASVAYATESGRASLSYVRSTNSGFGAVGGALSDSVSFSASRLIGRVWSTSANVNWSHASGLPSPGAPSYSFNTVIAAFQASRALARNLSGFASYTVEHQSNSSVSNSVNAFSGMNNIVGFGVTYSPVSGRLRRP